MSSPELPKGVSFDFGQVLAEFDPVFLATKLREQGVLDANPDALYGSLGAGWAAYGNAVSEGQGPAQAWKGFMAAVLAGAQLERSRDDGLLQWLYEDQRRRNLWRRPIAGMEALIKELGAKGVKVVVTSNSEGGLKQLISQLGWQELLPHVVDSGEFGVEKPDLRIFAEAARLVGLSPSQLVHIGDSWEADMVGIQTAGGWGLWFAPDTKPAPQPLGGKLSRAADANHLRAALSSFGFLDLAHKASHKKKPAGAIAAASKPENATDKTWRMGGQVTSPLRAHQTQC